KMYMNGLTASALAAIKIPIVLDSDRAAMEVALHSVGQSTDARVAIVRSTLELEHVWVSEALVPSAPAHPRLHGVAGLKTRAFGPDQRLAVVSHRRPMAHVPSSS